MVRRTSSGGTREAKHGARVLVSETPIRYGFPFQARILKIFESFHSQMVNFIHIMCVLGQSKLPLFHRTIKVDKTDSKKFPDF